jgi:hypothetical protein
MEFDKETALRARREKESMICRSSDAEARKKERKKNYLKRGKQNAVYSRSRFPLFWFIFLLDS